MKSGADPKLARAALGLGLLFLAALPSAAGTLSGPLPNEGLTAVLEDVFAVPPSDNLRPLAKIQKLEEAPDGSGRLFVADLRGPLWVRDGSTDSLYLDLSTLPDFAPGNLSTGLQSFALHPQFASNGLLYTTHTEFVGLVAANIGSPEPQTIVRHAILTEWNASDPAANVFAGTSQELIRMEATATFHGIQDVSFDPYAVSGDEHYGLLFLGVGEMGATSRGRPDLLQRTDGAYGAVLRIDPLGGPFVQDGVSHPYGIPASNPLASDPDPETRREIYALGFRNPHRFVWDPSGGLMPWVVDIGEGNMEELNLLAPEADYGWPYREGTFALDPDVDLQVVFALPPDDASFGYTYPVAQYDHDEGRAVAGGVVSRALAPTELKGALVFGDIVEGRIFHASTDELAAADDGDPATTAQVRELNLRHDGTEKTLLEIVADALNMAPEDLDRVDLRLATGLSGDLYLTTKQDGFVRRLVPLAMCDDGADNDGDERIDFDGKEGSDPDQGCKNALWATESPACQDGLDNDGRPGIDFDGGLSLDLDGNGSIDAEFNFATPPVGSADPQCGGVPHRKGEQAPKVCGLGFELALLAPVLAVLRRRMRPAA
jgi:hypothetical protein